MIEQTNLLKAITANVTILTPNRRLSATLHKLHQQQQLAERHTYWETPDILPVTSWLQRLWDHYHSRTFYDKPLLLNSIQEQYLWEEVLSQTNQSIQLLQVSETAEQVRSAWNLLKQWNVDIEQPLFKTSEDYRAFYQWSTQFNHLCKQKR